jgi:hypothetical protein
MANHERCEGAPPRELNRQPANRKLGLNWASTSNVHQHSRAQQLQRSGNGCTSSCQMYGAFRPFRTRCTCLQQLLTMGQCWHMGAELMRLFYYGRPLKGGCAAMQEYPKLEKQANWNVDTTPEPIEWDDLIAEALERGKAVPEVTWRQPGEDGAWEVGLLMSCCQTLELHSVNCLDPCFASVRFVLIDTTAHMVLAPLEPDTPVSPGPAPGSATFASAVSAIGRASVADLDVPQQLPLSCCCRRWWGRRTAS